MATFTPSSDLNAGLRQDMPMQITEFNFTWPGENGTMEDVGALNFTYAGGPWYWPWCAVWKSPQHYVFEIANLLFVISYAAPNTKKGQLFLHTILIFAFIVYSVWAWHMICAPDVFSWNFAFVFLNIGQLVSIIYMMRPVKFDPELEEVYHTLFEPFKVTRLQFKRMVSPEFAQIMSLHAGEAYAMQNLTKTDRLGLLLYGKVSVMSGQQFLHPILPCEFLDSPEFESSRATVDERFKVSIVAASSCRYLYWQRSALEYLFIKETYLATVMTTLIARDITTKLYAMNNKIVTDKGSHLDIRLPSITGPLSTVAQGVYKSPPRVSRAKYAMQCIPLSPDSTENGSKERLFKQRREERALEFAGPGPAAATAPELEPLAEPSTEDLTSTGLDSWHDTSSKYHSCEAVETDDELKQP